MKKLSSENLETFNGGLTNRECMIAGGLAFAAALGGLWGPAVIVTAGANMAGCFR